VKVVLEPHRDARIVRVDGYKMLRTKALKEFGVRKDASVRFYFLDEEGDRVLVSSKHSLVYSRRAYAKQQRAIKAKGKQVLKLLLLVDGDPTVALGTGVGDVCISAEVTQQPHGFNSRAVTSAHNALDESSGPRQTRMRALVAGIGMDAGAEHAESKEETKFDDSLDFSPESTQAKDTNTDGRSALTPIRLDAPSVTHKTGITPSSSGSARTLPSTICWQRGEKIGSGSFGVVYSGIDLVEGGRIAVKEVRLGDGKRFKQQAIAMQREVKLLSELQHENIIQYLGGKDVLR